jgi:UDP-N-acetylglucosamine 2-epimerase (non-hydrolysing)
MNIAIIVGTRPEIIKMSPIIKYCERNNIEHDIIHSQQHYSANMDRLFFEDLGISYPNLSLGVKSKAAHLQIGEIMSKCGDLFIEHKYSHVLVQGDTNTVLGAALAAQKCGIKLGHVEAGLRSFDREMPEEINRIVADNLSEFCFCPTELSAEHIRNAGIEDERIFVVGNTIVDSLYMNKEKFSKIDIENKLKISNRYALVTLHRPSNVDDTVVLNEIIQTLITLGKSFNYQIVFPVHPRTKDKIVSAGIDVGKIMLTDPLGYFDFLSLINNSSLILTDSGGIQEEACILNKPCITLRENTERPETIEVGANILTGLESEKILAATTEWQNRPKHWQNPFGDGTTSEKIISILSNS